MTVCTRVRIGVGGMRTRNADNRTSVIGRSTLWLVSDRFYADAYADGCGQR